MPQSNKRPEREPEPAPDESVAEVLQNEQIVDLPSREALSIVDPGAFGVSIPIGRTADVPPATSETPETPAST
jgi:hypothetical protein